MTPTLKEAVRLVSNTLELQIPESLREAVDDIVERHYRESSTWSHDVCADCREEWPCDTYTMWQFALYVLHAGGRNALVQPVADGE